MGGKVAADAGPGQGEKAAFTTGVEGGVLVLRLAGDWCLRAPGKPSARAGAQAVKECDEEGVGHLRFDFAKVTGRDNGIMPFLLNAIEAAYAREWEVDLDSLPEGLRNLARLARAVQRHDKVDKPAGEEPFLLRLGEGSLKVLAGLQAWFDFLGRTALALGRLTTGRTHMRRQDFLLILQSVSANALPIISLLALLVGMIIAFLGAVVLRRFGADYYVSYLVGYGVLREMGALMTGIIMAGRTGAAFAAQIGSMKVSEEIDALRTLGISPTDFLVLPRVVALVVTMPLLTIYADMVAIGGGFVVSSLMLEVPAAQFFQGMREAVALNDLLLGVFKGATFGVIIALSGCLRGMQTGSGADAVGRAATSAVVTAITHIVLANAIIDWIAATFNI